MHNMALMKVRNRLREIRRSKGLSAVDLEVLTGIDYQRIYQTERGIVKPSFSEKATLSEALGSSIKEIFPAHLEGGSEIFDTKAKEVARNEQA
jgi:transcriptional regulator with XRE-family HTH domain